MDDCVESLEMLHLHISEIPKLEHWNFIRGRREVTFVVEPSIKTDDVVSLGAKDRNRFDADVAEVAGEQYFHFRFSTPNLRRN